MDDYKGLDKETETGFLMQICCLFVYLFVCLFVCYLLFNALKVNLFVRSVYYIEYSVNIVF